MADPVDDAEEKVEFIKSLTAKEIKKLAKPEFDANPDKFYPTELLRKLGFARHECAKCKVHYWKTAHNQRATCGDSNCEGKYHFIGVGSGKKRDTPLTVRGAWDGFQKSFEAAKPTPCTAIARYPVVARWRADVDFVAAGIYCFQPYCVTGELEPPANPLICPQFCLRFNDLDNIGLTGRHYSGFVMLGIQAFNMPNKRVFWKEECVQCNYDWLTKELGIDPAEITIIEDVWAGGGNMGPSMEYFIGGLEVGNMVFMQYKTFPDGSREPLEVQVIDVGIGLERIPWLINGSPTSYFDAFPRALQYLRTKVGLEMGTDVWTKYGPYSCLLNVDEVDDLDAVWKDIADRVNTDVPTLKTAIEPVRDAYIVLDHTRSVLVAIIDGSLPSNIGGASNVRNVLRRVFSVLSKRGWWDLLGMEGLLQLFEHHKADLADLYGPFEPYKSFENIIKLEYERWSSTDVAVALKLKRLLKKSKGKLSMEDWIVAVTSWGVPADKVAELAKVEVPGNLWYEIADRQERSVRAAPTVLYSTAHLPPTDSFYFNSHDLTFDAHIVAILPNVLEKQKLNILVLNKSAFYPTSGGQMHDTGTLTLHGDTYRVRDVMKVGPCVLHVVDPPLPPQEDMDLWIGEAVSGSVDGERRFQLQKNHTAAHIVYASARRVLGPHVWQHGAKKDVHQAHLDITHYKSLTHEEEQAIQLEAMRIVGQCRTISKTFMAKDEAEKEYGFHLYQGGVVPGNELRVVSIADTDTEACCGTHCDNSAEVGMVKIFTTRRISDGVLRIYFVAGEGALSRAADEADILHSMTSEWGVAKKDLTMTASRFFEGYKKFKASSAKQAKRIIDLELQLFCARSEPKLGLFLTSEDSPTSFIGSVPMFAQVLKDQGRGVAFLGESFCYLLLGSKELMADLKPLQAVLDASHLQVTERLAESKSKEAEDEIKTEDKTKTKKKSGVKKPVLKSKTQVAVRDPKQKKSKPVKIGDVMEVMLMSVPNSKAVLEYLTGTAGFVMQGE